MTALTRQLTDAERVIYQARLDKAEIAYDELMTGKAVKRFVDQNGETVEYTAANVGNLARYITSLRELLNPALARCNRPRAFGFLF